MGLIRYILTSEARRDVKKLSAMADKVLALAPVYEKMDDETLIAQTGVLKERLNKGETLDDILFDAYAVVREAASRVLGMRHYKVQIMGGICLHQGRVAEMKTGEGKTLVETLPAYLNALSGKGVHIVTVNDYLASRDAEWMGKVYKFLGLTVGVIISGMEDDAKRIAYNSDITYGTNNEFGFDYLRDNLKKNLKNMVQRELNFAIVDEVDSILIDEARTPLIISGKGGESSEKYMAVDRFVRNLKVDEDFTMDIKEKTVEITEQGAEKAEKFFNLENFADVENADLSHKIQQALKAHHIFKRDNDYIINDGEVIIVDEFTGRLMIGRRYSDGLHQAIEAKEGVKVRDENKTLATITFQNYFRIYKKLSGMTGTAKTEEQEFRSIYGLDVIEIPTNKPVQRIDYNDLIYSTVKGKERAIINEIKTRHENGQPILVGTVTVEKSEEISRLLIKEKIKHNVLNAKNHAREADIVAQAGRYGAVTIATNMAGRGTDIMLGGNPEYLAKRKLRDKGVEEEKIDLATSFISEVDEEIAEIRKEYWDLYNEFKKETDAEKEKVLSAGGLMIIGSERHESRRIDNQLRGRSGRQGDPGASRFFISLEDDLAKRFGGDRLQRLYSIFKVDEDTPLEAKMLSRQIENAQRNIEGKNFGIRKQVLEYDDVMNKQREVMYAERMKVLKGENIHDEILAFIPDLVGNTLSLCVDKSKSGEHWDAKAINDTIERYLIPAGSDFIKESDLPKLVYEDLYGMVLDKTTEEYEKKIQRYKDEGFDFTIVERDILLRCVDVKWIDHIDSMDQLRKGISLRGYGGNINPVNEYKKEALEMFDDMIFSIQDETVKMLLKVELQRVQVREERQERTDLVSNQSGDGSKAVSAPKAKQAPGRNDPCPCGSGKKYKNCCGKNA